MYTIIIIIVCYRRRVRFGDWRATVRPRSGGLAARHAYMFAGLKPTGVGRSKVRRQESQLASGTQQPKTRSVWGRHAYIYIYIYTHIRTYMCMIYT